MNFVSVELRPSVFGCALMVGTLFVAACGSNDKSGSADGGSTAVDDAGEPIVDASPGAWMLDCEAIAEFSPTGNVLTVGPGKTYATPSEAAAVAQNGDLIEISAGVYEQDFAKWTQDNLTLRGVGGRAHLKATSQIPNSGNGKGIWITQGANIRIENIEFSGAQVADENGAGIRAEGQGLSICNSYFHENQNGILGGSGPMVIEHSEFKHNGYMGRGQTHNLYINERVTKLTFRYNYSHHAEIGHNLKSRAQENWILYNRINDEDSGNSSYAIDLPNGGLSYVIGNQLQQSANTDNSTLLSYGAEGLGAERTNKLYVVNNSFVNDRGTGTFVRAVNAPTEVVVRNNLFIGGGTATVGSTSVEGNIEANDGLVDRGGFDYHLASGSSAVNSASEPGTGEGQSLTPTHQYVHPMGLMLRPDDSALDVGAFEQE